MTDRLTSADGRWVWIAQPDGNWVRHDRTGVSPDIGLDVLGAPFWPPDDGGPIVPVPTDPVPPDGPVPSRVEGFGVSYYTAMTDPDCDPDAWANRTRDAGSRHTRLWLCDAWANGRLEAGTGMYEGFQPWAWTVNGFDLARVSGAYLDRLDRVLTAFHRTGQHVCLSILELYTWSARKDGRLWVPQRDRQPQRNNIQHVEWGTPDDDVWLDTELPDDALARVLEAVLQTIGARWRGVTFEIGNELPEKPLHTRVRDLVRSLGWQGRLQVNRNEDTPSQYDNMQIGVAFDALAIHGRETLAYLDEDFGPEQHAFRTFREAYASGTIDPARVVVSSDGVGRNQPPFYDEPTLIAVAQDSLSRGFAYEHQAREIKLGRFLQGRLDLADLDVGLCQRMQLP